MLTRLARSFGQRSRDKRGRFLRDAMDVDPSWSILDLGGGTGDHIAKVFPGHLDVTVCDYSASDLEIASAKHGFATVHANGSERLPFDDQSFDLVFCSSVIEHVTGPKIEAIGTRSGRSFRRQAIHHQAHFAREVSRVGRRHYVQTPHKLFLVESHSWLPLPFTLLPRRLQIPILRVADRILPKGTQPDWNLLLPSDMRRLFPDSVIMLERYSGWPKSIIAMKSKPGA